MIAIGISILGILIYVWIRFQFRFGATAIATLLHDVLVTLQTVMEQLGVTPNECIMVGDSGADVGAAHAAGIPIVLVPDGYIGVPAESLGADFVLKSLSSLPDEINRFRPVQKSA